MNDIDPEILRERAAAAAGNSGQQIPDPPPDDTPGFDYADEPAAKNSTRERGPSEEDCRQSGPGDSASRPTPLVRPIAPAEPYPLDDLGPVLAPAARAVMQHVQVPDALSAHAVLAGAALAAQAHANVETLGGARPISLYLASVAESGERKTAADALARLPVDEHRKKLLTFYTAAMRDYKAAHEGHKERVRLAKDNAADPEALVAALKEIQEEPAPRKPSFIASDPTAEGLFKSFREGQYSQTLATDEGGQFLGSYAMSAESELRTISMLSRLWDGNPIDRVRGADNDPIITLYGRRLAVHLMMQPLVANRLLGSELYRSQGILARFLICRPDSRIGTRLHDGTRVDPTQDGRLRKYWHAVRQLLELQAGEDHEVGGLNPPVLALAPEARMCLVDFNNSVEKRMRQDGGDLVVIRQFGSKVQEHACRMAAVLSLLADPNAYCVTAQTMTNAVQLMNFYLAEHIRLAEVAVVSEEVRKAQSLLEWIPRWIQRKAKREFTARDVMREGPNAIRLAPEAKAALRVLVEYGWLTTADSRRYVVSPYALDGA